MSEAKELREFATVYKHLCPSLEQLQQQIETEFAKQKLVIQVCNLCNSKYEVSRKSARGRNKYCGAACRQKAYRLRQKSAIYTK